MPENNKKIKIGFFGGPEYSVITLDKLCSAGFTISFVVTSIDKPKGRDLSLSPPPAKVWALKHDIPVFQPDKLKDQSLTDRLKKYGCDVFVVMAYGKIIPENILNIPKAKSLNIHPSLLPEFRGSCPIESAILNDKKGTGVTIIRMDSEMDHGPLVAQKEVEVEPWPPTSHELGNKLVSVGSDLLISILPDWINEKVNGKASDKIKEIEQDHIKATYTKKIEKEDGLIDFKDNPYKNYLKIQAYHGWPSAYFFVNQDNNQNKDDKNKKRIRIKITQASYYNGELIIEKVIPEGKKEMVYKEFISKPKYIESI